MFRILRLRLQIKFWRSLGQLAIWLRDSGQRCFTWYEQHSPMKIIGKSKAMPCIYPRLTCVLCKKPIDISTDYFDHDPMGYFHRVCPLPIPPQVGAS